MFNGNSNYSLADIAAATGNNNNDSFCGNGSAWWIIILFLIWGNWGGYGYGNGVFGGAGSTGSGITDGYILTSDFAKVESKLDSVNNGICSLGHDQLAQMNDINQNVSTQGSETRNAITQQTIADMQNINAVTAQITGLSNQIASCCCDNKNAMTQSFADLNYRLAEQSCQTRQTVADSTAAIIANQDANTRSILDFLTQDKIASLQAENQSLKFAASQSEQNNYLVSKLSPCPVPAYVVPNPYASTGCGCACYA